MNNLNKQFYVGEIINSMLENNLGDNFSITSSISIYDYYIEVKHLTSNRREFLQVNYTTTGKIQLRAQKRDHTFTCFQCPENITDISGISNHLLAEYLKYKEIYVKDMVDEISFHKKISEVLNCCFI